MAASESVLTVYSYSILFKHAINTTTSFHFLWYSSRFHVCLAHTLPTTYFFLRFSAFIPGTRIYIYNVANSHL